VEERVGMNVLRADRGWSDGGPTVLLSPWWIREHWGRAFDIERVDDGMPGTQGLVVARPRQNPPSRAELERIDVREPREIAALSHNVNQLRREAAAARAHVAAEYESSRSWRVTAPLRKLYGAMRTALRGFGGP
jgi:hypothetical protein